MGKVLASGQQPAQQSQGHAMMEGSIGGRHRLECCLWTDGGGLKG